MKRYIWIAVAVLLLSVLAIIMVIALRNRKEGNEAVTPEKQENEVVEVDTVTRTNESEVEILPEDNEVTVKGKISQDTLKTDAIRRYKDDNVINSYVVGRWQNTDKKGCYCVFYNEVDEDDMCWGKEWDESENVNEEDLVFHKNGWFRWRVKDGVLHKFAVMDMSSAVIHKAYIIKDMKNDALVIQDVGYDSYRYSFVKVE